MRLTPVFLCSLSIGWGLAARPSFAAAPPEIITPERIAELRSVTEVAISPDGQHVAYLRSIPRRPGVDDDGEPWSELWMFESASAQDRPLVTGHVTVEKIAWTVDRRGVAFVAKRGDDKFKALHVIPIDGGEARRAAILKSDLAGFSLAPDGKRVALLASEPETETRKKMKERGFKQEVFEEDWSFTRLWIASLFEDNAVRAATSAVTGSVRQVSWSPTADRLAIVVTPTPSVDDGLMRQELQVVDAATNGIVRARMEHASKLTAVDWSPDGQQLGVIAGQDQNDPSAGRLWVVPATGGRPRDLLPALEADVTAFAWTSGDELVLAAAKGAVSFIGKASTRGETAGLTNLHGPSQPIITALSLARDGRTAAIAANAPSHPSELFTLSLDAPHPIRRTDCNPALAKVRLARQEVIRFQARDGLDLEGILIHPLDEKELTRYPLILTVHGGPEAHESDGWLTTYSRPGQTAAARGFAVFYPNYRGSTGRGVAFSKLSQGDPAGREFDDLIDGVDHLIGAGLVDRERVGVTGGSYGGYATAWCCTRLSERFAAGVMFVGISDKISKVGTTDIPDEEFLVHARKRPWEDWPFLLERSPIFHAGNARTPLLILHGADDPRVHPGQSKELYRHLKLRSRAPVRLVLYPGEGHGNRKAAARYDYHLRSLQWFEHYLKGPGGAMPSAEVDYHLPESEGAQASEKK